MVKIIKDEWYPVYSINCGNWDYEIELNKEEIEFVKRSEKQFDESQKLIRDKIDKL